MDTLKIHQERIDADTAGKLIELCPFSAIKYDGGMLSIDAGCKMCRLCVKNGPPGAITLEPAESVPGADKDLWRGIAVYAEYPDGKIHNVTKELMGKARELAAITGHPVIALLLGNGTEAGAEQLLRCGADKVYVYDYPELEHFRIDTYANAFSDFIRKVRPSSVLVGATNTGRSLAPRVAARFRTGLTADCTVLEMKENTDLVQIRPAFGGNIMARIVTPNHRPQFCTVRYKVFAEPEPVERPSGVVERMELAPELLKSCLEIVNVEEKPREADLSEAKVIVAVGRGIKSKGSLAMARELADRLGGQLACTRPLIENGWFDAKKQIGLSGRTVNADLIVTLGISGSVQFAAGMRGSQRIIAVNSDKDAAIFDIAHHGIVGDLYEVVPRLLELIRGENRGGLE